jgi:deoxynucleoside kinase
MKKDTSPLFSMLRCCKMMKPFTIIVEGNIGAGKTTLLDKLKDLPKVKTFKEDINRWKNLNGHNLLNLVYQDPIKNNFVFQNEVFTSQMRDILHGDMPINIFERSPYSSFHIFISNMKNRIRNVEYASLQSTFEFITGPEGLNFKPDLVVYLRTSPEIALERLQIRGRPEEKTLTLEFIAKIHELHENWLIGHTSPVPAPVLILEEHSALDTLKEIIFHQINERIESTEHMDWE